MSQSTSVLVESNPQTTVFDPISFYIPSPSRYPHDMLTSPSTAIVALGSALYIPTRIQHETDLVFPNSQFNTSMCMIATSLYPTTNYQSCACQPSPAPPVVQVRIPPPPHVYHQINTTIERDIAAIIQSHTFNDKKSYTCVWSNCPFVTHSKAIAFTHAHKHLGNPKLYACSCGTGFACQASAKRHCDARNKIFECAFCLKKFARRDYRLVHQRKCNTTHPV